MASFDPVLILTDEMMDKLTSRRNAKGRTYPDLTKEIREWCDHSLKGPVDLFWDPRNSYDYLLFENEADLMLFKTWWT